MKFVNYSVFFWLQALLDPTRQAFFTRKKLRSISLYFYYQVLQSECDKRKILQLVQISVWFKNFILFTINQCLISFLINF